MKSSRMQQLQNNPTSPPSESYTTLSENEKRCAAKIQEFQSDFVGKYPELKERAAFLHPPNEYSIKKFACTAIQPTLLPNTELYDLERCAEFVATFVQYEPLYPEPVIVSPTQLISWGEGDALDTSVLLASLLIGAGFDAYVIVGIAPVYIRLKDQSRMKCTLEERQRDDPTMPWDFEVVINDDSSVKKDDDLGLHCWVLVKPGKRELAGGSCFVESSTGIIYPLNENMPYSQMWCAFSDKNFWINASSGAVPTYDFSTWLQVPGISPYSYVKRIEIPPKLLALRYPPTGRRCLLLNKAKIEYFGKAIDPQGVATRIITFEDEAQTIVVQVTELFYPNIRDDGLFQRIRRPFDMSCSERYCDKNPYSIRERSETVSTRTISFDSNTRSDGLVERTESIGKSITEHYHNRSDSLVRRVVSLEKLPRNTKQPRHGSFLACGTGLGLAEVTRIDDHYAEPFDKAHLKTSVASRSYLLKEKKIVVTYHCRHEALQTRNTFVKDEIFEPDSKGHELLALESKSMSALKEINDEMVELREAMYHWDMRLVTSPETSKVDAAAPNKDARLTISYPT